MFMAMVMMAMTVGVTVIVMTGIGGASALAGHQGVSGFVRVIGRYPAGDRSPMSNAEL